MRKSEVFTAICAFLFCAIFAAAQTITTGDIAGVVTDSSGAVVPGATIILRFPSTNASRTTKTSGTGEYRISLLPAGEYVLSAESAGLKSNIEKFTVQIGQELQMNIRLSVTGTQEVVTVVSEAAAIQTENANSTTAFSQKQIEDLPMNGSDLTTLANTAPGVRVNVKGGSGNVNANGVPGASILFTLNGADVMDPYNNLNNSGASNNTLGANEIAEAAVIINAYSPQYGRMAAGQVNLVGKSGSNGFHGNLNWGYNDAAFNANTFFKNSSGTPRGRADSNIYGGSVGGPVWRNHTFFFFDSEGLRYALPASTLVSIPSPQLQSYTLAHIPSADIALYQQAFTLYNAAPGLNRAVPVTTGTGQLQDSSGKLGCGGKGTFTGTAFGTTGQKFGVDVPCALSFVSANNQLNTESLQIVRIDQVINSAQRINFRYQYDVGVQATGTSALNPAFNSVSTQPQHQGMVNHSWVLGPSLVNNFIGAASWYSAIFGVADFSKTSSLMAERFSITDGGAQGNGMTGVGAAIPNGRNVGQLELIDDISWTRGKHTLKAGVNYRFNKVTTTNLSASTQIGLYTFNDLVDFTTGQINSTGKGSAFSQAFAQLAAGHIRAYSLNFYVGDDWNVSKKLKLNYGFRFERDGNPSCLDNCFARMNEQFGTAAYQGGVNIPYNQTITTGLHSAYHSLEPVITEPRFGFVATPFGNDKTVIRGGIGLNSNLFAVSVANNLDTNSPSYFLPSVTFGQVGTPADPLSSAVAAQQSYVALINGFKAGYTMGQIQTALGKIAFSPPNYYSPPQDFAAPKILNWSLEVQRELTPHNVVSIGYTGNHGYDESISNANANGWLRATALYPNGFAGLPTTVPDGRFLTVTQVLTKGVSNYDGMTVQIRHSYSYGFQGQLNWTWSHSLGTVGVYNPNNLNAGYGPLSFDTRHAVSADGSWTSPWKPSNKLLNAAVGGWMIGAKMYLYSGPPFSVTNSSLAARLNSGGGLGNTVIADLIDPGALGVSCGKSAISTPCLTAAQFQTTTTQTDFGNTAPNMFRGAGYFDIDSQLTKTYAIKERLKLGLNFQFYNLLNHPNLANASGTVTSGSLGLISSTVSQPSSVYGTGQGAAVSGRLIVVGAKVTF